MTIKWDAKDPDAVLDYEIDWLGTADEPGFLFGTDDTIDTSEWIVPDGITKDSAGKNDANTATTIWLSGGTVGTTYSLINRITTVGGRTNDRTAKLQIKQR